MMKKLSSLKTVLALGLLGALSLNGSQDHESAKPNKKGSRKVGVRSPGDDPCLGGRGLAAFANGDDYNLEGMVSFLTETSCQERQSQIVRDALSQRISFNEVPFRLKQVASHFDPGSLQSVEQTNQTLLRVVPVILKDHPLTNNAILPILGQVAVLSQPAARKVLAGMIQTELISGDALIKTSNREKGTLAADLAKTIIAYGASSPLIAAEIAESTEEMALSSQVDSLGKVLSALIEAARAEAELIPTLEATVGGTRRGLEKGDSFLSVEEKQALLKLVFDRIKPGFLAEPEFDGVSSDFNRALKVLLKNKTLNQTALRDAWKECLQVLSVNRNQSALAVALGLSLTGDMVFLNKTDKQLLLMAANNYRFIALAVQRSFLSAWDEAWDNLHDRSLPPALFNSRKDKYFVPTAEGILELDPEFIEREWVKFVWERGFVRDEQIETRFPKIVLVQLKRREAALKKLTVDNSLQNQMASMAESLAVSRFLSSVQVPAL
ncbi:MAG: hypothetical protein ACKN9V_01765, partial [Pseudomonadota bacterium]